MTNSQATLSTQSSCSLQCWIIVPPFWSHSIRNGAPAALTMTATQQNLLRQLPTQAGNEEYVTTAAWLTMILGHHLCPTDPNFLSYKYIGLRIVQNMMLVTCRKGNKKCGWERRNIFSPVWLFVFSVTRSIKKCECKVIKTYAEILVDSVQLILGFYIKTYTADTLTC